MIEGSGYGIWGFGVRDWGFDGHKVPPRSSLSLRMRESGVWGLRFGALRLGLGLGAVGPGQRI